MATEGAARGREPASHSSVVESKLAMEYWAAVQDCLVKFHSISRETAAEKIMDLWRRLTNISPPENPGADGQDFMEDIIYHEEPWYVACDLAENEIPLDDRNRQAYEKILQDNHLA